MKLFRGTLIFLVLLEVSNADNNQSTQNEFIYIDELHKSISETVIEWSEIIDTTLSSWLENNDSNTTDIKANVTDNRTIHDENTTVMDHNSSIVKTNRTIIPTYTRAVKPATTTVQDNTVIDETNQPSKFTLEEKVHSVDQFFQSEKYLDETENTYIRVRIDNYLESKGSNDFGMTVRAQMPFSQSKKRFKIFVDDLTLDNADQILQNPSNNEDDATPDIGLHYFASRHKILSRYSVGLSGIDPFVKARFNMPINIDEWLIDPVQSFRYSTDNKFEEETNIYFDRKVGEKSLLRIQLHRGTQDEVDGMNYAFSAQYYRSTKIDTGFGFAQSFFGNTEYEYITEKGVPHPKTERYGGIYDYVTSATWRANIWRKWFYYEVRPSVSFHKQYDYEPNYRIRILFDFYFGNHH